MILESPHLNQEIQLDETTQSEGAGASLSAAPGAENVRQLRPTPQAQAVNPFQAKIDQFGEPMHPVTLTFDGHEPLHFIGATVRDHFAALAPDVPVWFEYLPGPDQQPPARPVLQDQPPEVISAVAKWNNGTRDVEIDDALRPWQRLLAEYDKAVAAYDKNIVASRYMTWRWHYANMMISMRGS